MNASPRIHLYPNFTGDALDRLVAHGRIVLVGDAAHPHGGAFAAGGSLGIDDAYILMRSFAHHLKDRTQATPEERQSQIARSLELYEQTRQPHVSRIVKAVHNGEQYKNTSDNVWDDAKIRAWATGRVDPFWIHEHPVDQAFEDAVKQQEAQLESYGAEMK